MGAGGTNTTSENLVFQVTDPQDRTVWMTEDTLQHSAFHHPEIKRDVAGHIGAATDPAVIYQHSDEPDTLIYVGQPRPNPEGMQYADLQRGLIVNKASDPPGEVTTAYNIKASTIPHKIRGAAGAVVLYTSEPKR